ncbi:MAG: hypothetical protein DME43_01820 [Verrucomicrobia bacterium]|nr:MAG: hypothetical protein DME43_01820 [Verrucomicrobiota bacterium]PYK72055.1 MAG: hypothetical protein DME44_05655 [Verrucomicrobiota bacterium]
MVLPSWINDSGASELCGICVRCRSNKKWRLTETVYNPTDHDSLITVTWRTAPALFKLLSQQSRRIGKLGELLTALIHTHRQANECVLRVWFCAGLVVPATDQVRLIKLDWIGAKRFCLVRLE